MPGQATDSNRFTNQSQKENSRAHTPGNYAGRAFQTRPPPSPVHQGEVGQCVGQRVGDLALQTVEGEAAWREMVGCPWIPCWTVQALQSLQPLLRPFAGRLGKRRLQRQREERGAKRWWVDLNNGQNHPSRRAGRGRRVDYEETGKMEAGTTRCCE